MFSIVMLRPLWYLFIIVGFCIIFYQYGTEETSDKPCPPCRNKDKDESNLNPDNYIIDKQFDRMFIDSSVWNNYDIGSVNKVYKFKDLDNINVTL